MTYSFSQWERYNQCPANWKYKVRDRLPTSPAGPAAQRGLEIHATIEAYINGAQPWTLHPAIKPDYVHVFDEFRRWSGGDRWTERKLGMDKEWSWASPEDPEKHVLMVLDVVAFHKPKAGAYGKLKIGEWKSGKPKDTHKDQRTIYALGGLTWWQADEVEVETHYVEGTADTERLIAKRSALPKLIRIWDDRFKQMEDDKICAPRPGRHCDWCDFSRLKGGPCRVG